MTFDNVDGQPATAGDTLVGLGGNDTYSIGNSFYIVTEAVGGGFDTVYSASDYALNAGSEIEVLSAARQNLTSPLRLTGNEFAQTIAGNYGNNVLTGGGGADTLIGLRGDDTYVVTDRGTVIVENDGEGNDTVLTSVDVVLTAGASVETLRAADPAGTAAINLQGSTASQTITGNAGNNILNGFGGADTLIGLGGNDTFLVRGPGDVVIETNGGGFDTVYTTVSYNLGENEVEVLSTVTQAETTAIDLIGNFVSQYVVGNYGDNLLNGGSGADTLIGLRGNDLYAVGDARILIVEADGEGADTVVTSVDYALGAGVSVEVLAAQSRGGTGALVLRGNAFAQTIAGNDGANTIDGGAGSDALIGGGGRDTFAFTTALGPNNVDAIQDFASGTDRIALASDVFARLAGGVGAGNFVVGAAALDGDDYLVYNQASGELSYDADGSGAGAAVVFARLVPGTALSVADFTVIAPVPSV